MKKDFKSQLTAYLDAGYIFLAVETHEEHRALVDIRDVVSKRIWKSGNSKNPVSYYEWDQVTGMERLEFSKEEWKPSQVNGTQEPVPALNQIKEEGRPSVFVFKDMHPYMDRATVWRLLRNLEERLKGIGGTVIFISSRHKIPPELSKEIQLVNYALPTKDELKVAFMNFFLGSVQSQDKYKDMIVPSSSKVESIAEAASGMSAGNADDAFALAALTVARSSADSKLHFGPEFATRVFEEKIVTLKQSALEYVPDTTGFEEIGGMDQLKEWAIQRRRGFDADAREMRLPCPRGLLIDGPPGVGKTKISSAIAHEFGFPLFMLDVGKLFASKVGESEALTRELIQTLESLGRAVILIDEIERCLGVAATGGSGDSGTSSRMFGTLLTWLSTKTCPIFIIGTMNNHDRMPPELLRPGRFDAVFWVDLPTKLERQAIFRALLVRRYHVSEADMLIVETGMPELISSTRDCTGAEIAAIIENALYAQLINKDVPFYTHLCQACEAMQPQAQLDPTRITAMREKAKAFRRASSDIEVSDAPALPRTTGKNNRKLSNI